MTTESLSKLMSTLTDAIGPTFEAMEWAEDEIQRAARRHPEAADRLWHSFSLLTPRDGMGVEFVYRSHARELLDRVARGEDTRPGTAAEVCLVCKDASLVAPLTTGGVGLYMRMWLQAFPDRPVHDGQADDQVHYEAMRGSQIDDLEAKARHRTADPDRRLKDITCRGVHHGEPVNCRYAVAPEAPEQLDLLALAAA